MSPNHRVAGTSGHPSLDYLSSVPLSKSFSKFVNISIFNDDTIIIFRKDYFALPDKFYLWAAKDSDFADYESYVVVVGACAAAVVYLTIEIEFSLALDRVGSFLH